jgi:hypothetical protein
MSGFWLRRGLKQADFRDPSEVSPVCHLAERA